MNDIVTFLQKAEHPMDQVVVGLVRASRTTDTIIKVLQSVKAADLGTDSNAVIDELIVIANKFLAIVGSR
jgi:uncharacterized membrane protein